MSCLRHSLSLVTPLVKISFELEGVQCGDIFRKKRLYGQERKELFRKMIKVHIKIYNIHIYFQKA